MNLTPGQMHTSLGTPLTFEVIDMRGRNGFPKDDTGYVFVHHERRVLKRRYTGLPYVRTAEYRIRTDPHGWRVDHTDGMMPPSAIYGENRREYFASPEQAAEVLKAYLDKIEAEGSFAA